jgi:hypothetical protein
MEKAISPTNSHPVMPPLAPTSLMLDPGVSIYAFYCTTRGAGWKRKLQQNRMIPIDNRIVLANYN